MSPTPQAPAPVPAHHVDHHPYRAIVLKGGISGVLMGLANLVPGVSAGAVMLATGIFKAFLTALADVVTFKWTRKTFVLLGTMGCAWTLAILLGAGPIKALVVDYRWIMYSIFIGLTLGGVPLVWAPGDKKAASFWLGGLIGLVVMTVLGLAQILRWIEPGQNVDNLWILLIGGVLAAGATVLPGGSGTFVLILMGLYVPVLGAVDAFKNALIARDLAAAMTQGWVLGPLAIGMLVGLASISVLLKWTLSKFPSATYGVLLGLLLGSVVGLWPFQQGVQPKVGDVVKGRPLTAEMAARLKPDDWPVEFFAPSAIQIAWAAGLILVACAGTIVLTRAEQRLEARDAESA